MSKVLSIFFHIQVTETGHYPAAGAPFCDHNNKAEKGQKMKSHKIKHGVKVVGCTEMRKQFDTKILFS